MHVCVHVFVNLKHRRAPPQGPPTPSEKGRGGRGGDFFVVVVERYFVRCMYGRQQQRVNRYSHRCTTINSLLLLLMLTSRNFFKLDSVDWLATCMRVLSPDGAWWGCVGSPHLSRTGHVEPPSATAAIFNVCCCVSSTNSRCTVFYQFSSYNVHSTSQSL